MKENIVPSTKLKPFIKWAGGKSALLDEIRKFYPSKLGQDINKYCEPFVGAGAVLFDILNSYNLKEIYISDVNNELINVWKTIQINVEPLIFILKKMEDEYINLDDAKRKEYFYQKRKEFNKYILREINDIVYGSALFIFLNRTCFNGLYRVNKDGLFNVPIGKYKNPKICDEDNLRNISLKLKNVIISCSEYTESAYFIDQNTLVYFDPPYRPITKTASFTSYSKFKFGDKQQIELADYYTKSSNKGAMCILSNSDPKNNDNLDNFFDDLYKLFNINRISTSRKINPNPDKRKSIVTELLITNNFK
ncbi:Dam family site-specific DNA-(adenine-N6)-methyltransferase [Mycoplasma miroungirhinis]|uniref:Site-specific DNA-methyltransferase (adenine-specific) n=2 Tax=Mycoplasma miroungirhinis TaxID=754516 RepID=A0A6M4JC20_9MOLU|nr:Dam family site-specific DNA-(adenine-N6)-methyltransferase [Mycoplasma miroungirhinis]